MPGDFGVFETVVDIFLVVATAEGQRIESLLLTYDYIMVSASRRNLAKSLTILGS